MADDLFVVMWYDMVDEVMRRQGWLDRGIPMTCTNKKLLLRHVNVAMVSLCMWRETIISKKKFSRAPGNVWTKVDTVV